MIILILRPRDSVFGFHSITQCRGIKMPSAGLEPRLFETWHLRIQDSNHYTSTLYMHGYEDDFWDEIFSFLIFWMAKFLFSAIEDREILI